MRVVNTIRLIRDDAKFQNDEPVDQDVYDRFVQDPKMDTPTEWNIYLSYRWQFQDDPLIKEKDKVRLLSSLNVVEAFLGGVNTKGKFPF